MSWLIPLHLSGSFDHWLLRDSGKKRGRLPQSLWAGRCRSTSLLDECTRHPDAMQYRRVSVQKALFITFKTAAAGWGECKPRPESIVNSFCIFLNRKTASWFNIERLEGRADGCALPDSNRGRRRLAAAAGSGSCRQRSRRRSGQGLIDEFQGMHGPDG